jgi:aryl-alcohol dehydrogenase-like predicted oxidoreductase
MTWGQQNSEAEAHEQLSYAVDERGVKFLDTAEFYPIPPDPKTQGRTETYIGNWLKKRGKRDDLIIATKVAVSGHITTRQTTRRYDRTNIRAAIEGSLKRLQTDYVDLYQIHYPERPTNFFGVRGYKHDEADTSTAIEHTLTVLGELVKEGKVRHIGVSNETPWGVMEYLRLASEKDLPRIVSIQNQYSLTNRTFDIGLAEMCIKENIGLLAYSALNMGVLSGKYLDAAPEPGTRFSLPTLADATKQRYNPAHAQTAIRRYVQIARDHGLDPAQMAIAFARDRQPTTSVIIGATTVGQLKTDIDASNLKLSAEVLSVIEDTYTSFPDVTV